MNRHFEGSFTQQLPIPEDAIARAVEVMRSGRLHRYNTIDGETPEVSLLEQEFAAYVGAPYCLAVASGGYALQAALRAVGVAAGDPVLTNGFTLSPVPGSIAALGARPILVEITPNLVIDLEDLRRKADESGARVLMLSHMRGHIVDMEALMALARDLGLTVVEDCAHTMGGAWNGVPSGRHGIVACYSTQTYKHINSGEGGFIVSGDAELMARAILLSGSYMLYERHGAAPPAEVFRDVRLETPNCSGRMDNLRAAILRVQLASIDAAVHAWNERYRRIASQLAEVHGITLTERPPEERYVGSSIQFLTEGLDPAGCERFVVRCGARGVELKWFGRSEPTAFTSRYDSWRYIDEQRLPVTDAVLARLFDMRIPLTFSLDDCELIGGIIGECFLAVRQGLETA